MASAAVYQPSVYDALPRLETASESFIARNPQKIMEERMGALFLKHEVYDDLAVCLIHRHFDLAANEKLVEFGAVSSPWSYTQNDSDMIGGSVVPRTWKFVQGKMRPFEFGYNEALGEPIYKQLPNKPEFYKEFNNILQDTGTSDLLGLTLHSDKIPTDQVKFEKTFDRANVAFTVTRDGEMYDKEDAVPAQWIYKELGGMIVPVKKFVCFVGCVCGTGPK